MHKFDYSFLEKGNVPASIVNITGSIYSLRTAADIRKNENLSVFSGLQRIAKIQSVKSSNAIEGIRTSDDRLTAIVNQDSAPLNHNEAEIAGYRDALNIVHTQHDTLEFSIDMIRRLHETMMTLSGDDLAGQFKRTNNVIVEVGNDGSRSVRFRPVSAADTPAAMEQLELAYLDACSNSNINPLLLIPCVILDFLCIHPFRDGNGRVSRLLSLLLLYKAGFDVGKYVSFEEQINNYKEFYYESLDQSSVGWDDNTNDYAPFLQNFLSTLYMCYKELDKRFAIYHSGKVNKTEQIEATVLNSLTPMSKANICEILPDVSPTTVEAVLGRMVRAGQIRKIGAGRNTQYIKA